MSTENPCLSNFKLILRGFSGTGANLDIIRLQQRISRYYVEWVNTGLATLRKGWITKIRFDFVLSSKVKIALVLYSIVNTSNVHSSDNKCQESNEFMMYNVLIQDLVVQSYIRYAQ